MKNFEVWHADPPDFYAERPITEFPTGYVKVADVTAVCQNGVFDSTQHNDMPWTARTNVRPCRDQVRSTSVGDVVVEGPIAYRCESVGWTSHRITR
jgi:hypothetical protein